MKFSAFLFLFLALLASSRSTEVTTDPRICNAKKLDAITKTISGSTYVFSGKYYWEIKCFGVPPGYPRLISDDWKGLPDDLDAGLLVDKPEYPKYHGGTFFFKGNQTWRFRNRNPIRGYPKPIREIFPGIPDDIDAATQFGSSGKLYFIKGNEYWHFEPEVNVSGKFPQQIWTKWNGLRDRVDAAVQWDNGVTYFTVGDFYDRYDEPMKELDRRASTRSFSLWWSKCRGANGELVEPGP